MPTIDYLFIDESGDLGNGQGDSSDYYAELVLHINDKGFPRLMTHITNWRYIRQVMTEQKKLPRGRDLETFLRPLSELQQDNTISCSSIYLVKNQYTGPYLKASSPRGEDPILFRNFVHRQLLEYHFSINKPTTTNIELVFDRFEMSQEAFKNLEDYLRGNYSLPDLKHITHADSLYTEALQVTSQLVNQIKDVALRTATEELKALLSFISIKDITNIQKP